MTKIMVADRRYSISSRALKRSAWIKIAEYEGKNIERKYDITDEIRNHWEKNKSFWGYATFRGIEKRALEIISLAKGGLISLAINRWAEVIGYKILKK